jgi:hypothetical protein
MLAVAFLLCGACGLNSEPAPGAPVDGVSDHSARLDAGPDSGGHPALDQMAFDSGPRDGLGDGGAPPLTDGQTSPTWAGCTPLGSPTGPTIVVNPSQASSLPETVANAASGTTILLTDGTYKMQGDESGRRLSFKTPNVSLRSASGSRDAVVIDGEYKTAEMIFISANDVTIADLTLRRAVDHLIHVVGAPGNVLRTRIHNLKLLDAGEQFVKVNSDGNNNYADDGILECSELELTASGRANVEPNFGGCYTGGIDAHGARGWIVRRNSFRGIYCTNGALAEHAIHFWTGSRDTLVEQNTVVDCARGIGFGLTESGASRTYADDPYPNVSFKGHIDGVIRNNLVHVSPSVQPYYDTGIELAQAHGARVLHNTLATLPLFSSIDYRFSNTKVTIQNNLTYKITKRDGAQGTVAHNLQATPLGIFVDAPNGDYHLNANAADAIDKGVLLVDGGYDLEGTLHDAGLPDLGALEYRP